MMSIKKYVDAKTYSVILHLLEYDSKVDLKDYIYNYLPNNENALWFSIQEVKFANPMDDNLFNISREADERWKNGHQTYIKKFKLKEEKV